jgi:rhamnulokinase
MTGGAVAAIDLGATSGRVMLGRVAPNELRIRLVARFPNRPVRDTDGLHWDVLGLYDTALDGLARALRDEPELASVGVDAWGCDYGLFRDGELLSQPFHYRDDRTAAAIARVYSRVAIAELHAANGLQHLPFNTVFQLVADQSSGALDRAEEFLMIPDLIVRWLTGRRAAEKTNASTTGLLGVQSRLWDDALIERVGLPLSIFPGLVDAGTEIGRVRRSVAQQIGAGPHLTVTAVGSHDTASAVVAVPATSDDFAYISCGTWSLVGVELDQPYVTEAGRRAGFTNESGVDGRVRYLHNVMGLWLLSESVRTWEANGDHVDLRELLSEASVVSGVVFDPDDPRFLSPGDLPARIAEVCLEQGLPLPSSRAELVRSILDSLAQAYARTLRNAVELTGKIVSVVHMVGGGSQNELLCQLTADRTGLPVLAGPAEATSIGNILVQARAQGLVTGSLESLRELVAASYHPVAYRPRREGVRGAV